MKKRKGKAAKKAMKFADRRAKAEKWVAEYDSTSYGRDIIKAYKKKFAVDRMKAVAELQMLGISLTKEQIDRERAAVKAYQELQRAKKAKRKKAREQKGTQKGNLVFHEDQDDTFYVTEFKVPGEQKKLYLSAVLDLYDRYPVAYVVSARNDNRPVFETFDRAIAALPDAKPVFHSDRGFQYTSKMFQKKLEKQDMEQSMSRVGHCIDNGPTEGFWGIIKTEMYQRYKITDEASLRYAIQDYLRFYSEERPQDRYHCKTPLEVHQEALYSDMPIEYPIPENKRINKYKEKWCA